MSTDEYRLLAMNIAAKHGLDPDVFARQIQQESGFNPKAVSPVGAQGLGQLMPATAKALGVTDPFDPVQNLDAAARYMKSNIDRYGSIELALAAYNGGPGAVNYFNRHGGVFFDPKAPASSWAHQTGHYVQTILGGQPGGTGKKSQPGVVQPTLNPSQPLPDPLAGIQTVGVGGNLVPGATAASIGLEPANPLSPPVQPAVPKGVIPSLPDLMASIQRDRLAASTQHTNFFSDIPAGFGSVFNAGAQPGGGGLGTFIGRSAGMIAPAIAGGVVGNIPGAVAGALAGGGLAEYNDQVRAGKGINPLAVATGAGINAVGTLLPEVRGANLLSKALKSGAMNIGFAGAASGAQQLASTGKIDPGQALSDAVKMGAPAAALQLLLHRGGAPNTSGDIRAARTPPEDMKALSPERVAGLLPERSSAYTPDNPTNLLPGTETPLLEGRTPAMLPAGEKPFGLLPEFSRIETPATLRETGVTTSGEMPGVLQASTQGVLLPERGRTTGQPTRTRPVEPGVPVSSTAPDALLAEPVYGETGSRVITKDGFEGNVLTKVGNKLVLQADDGAVQTVTKRQLAPNKPVAEPLNQAVPEPINQAVMPETPVNTQNGVPEISPKPAVPDAVTPTEQPATSVSPADNIPQAETITPQQAPQQQTSSQIEPLQHAKSGRGASEVGDFEASTSLGEFVRKNKGVYTTLNDTQQKALETTFDAIKNGYAIDIPYRTKTGSTSTVNMKTVTPTHVEVKGNGIRIVGLNSKGQPGRYLVHDMATNASPEAGLKGVPTRSSSPPVRVAANAAERAIKTADATVEAQASAIQRAAAKFPNNPSIQAMARELDGPIDVAKVQGAVKRAMTLSAEERDAFLKEIGKKC